MKTKLTSYTIIVVLLFTTMISFSDEWHERANEYWNSAQKLKQEKNYTRALEQFKKSILAEKKSGNPRKEEFMSQLIEIAGIYRIIGQFDESLKYFGLLHKFAKENSDAGNSVTGLNGMGESYYALEQYESALDSFRKGYEIAKSLQRMDKEAILVNNIAKTLRILGDYDGALKHYDTAYRITEKQGIKSNVAAILSNIGTLYYFLNKHEKALSYYFKAMEIEKSAGEKANLSVDFSNAGIVFMAMGKYGEALNYFEQAIAIDREIDNKIYLAAHLNRLGTIYYSFGDSDKALELYNNSLMINRDLGKIDAEADVMMNIGVVYESLGKKTESVEFYIKALALDEKIKKKDVVSHSYSDIGMLYEIRGRYFEAADFYSLALQKNKDAGNKWKIAQSMNSIGRIYVTMGKFDDAISYLGKSLEIHNELGSQRAKADVLRNIGMAYFNQKIYDKAIEYFEQSLQTIQREKKKYDLASVYFGYEVNPWLIAAHAHKGNTLKAFSAMENSTLCRIRTFIQVLAGKECRLHEIPDDQQKRLQEKSALIAYSNTGWDTMFQIYLDRTNAVCYQLNKGFIIKDLQKKFGKEIRDYGDDMNRKSIIPAEYDAKREFYKNDFNSIITFYRSLISKKHITRQELDTLNYMGRALYKLLFQNIEKSIKDMNEIIILPEGILTLFPFETLIMPDGRFLVEQYDIKYMYSETIAYKTSLRTYSGNRRPISVIGSRGFPKIIFRKEQFESDKNFLYYIGKIYNKIMMNESIRQDYGLFGLSDISDESMGGLEIRALGNAFKDSAVTEKSLTDDEFITLSRSGALKDFKIVHMALPAVVIPDIPLLTALAFVPGGSSGKNDDGFIDPIEISDLDFSADSVTVSRIQYSSNSVHLRGEGLWMLCDSLVQAGANGVIMPLWDVDEASRIIFLRKAYAHSLMNKVHINRSLNETKRAFINGSLDVKEMRLSDEKFNETGEEKGRYRNPYYWASFVYYGK